MPETEITVVQPGDFDPTQFDVDATTGRITLVGVAASDPSYVADTVLSGERAVVFLPDGNVALADPLNLADFVYAGVTLGAVQAGQPIGVRTIGTLTQGYWGWTPGAPIFVALDGSLTQVPPVRGLSVIVGRAVNATTIRLLPETPIYLGD